ncbi:MAG: hypothetical protein CMF50_07685 [Legionellales bacterium]|nr:hypothetical protein [Legionellales bacterium]|tara:strand:+ start:15492 stop:15740 length:249 start_codon:yes stop_codon:yes gene_type:complete
MSQSRKISVIKAISWRTFATLTTIVISYIVVRKVSFAITIGSLEVIVKIFLYYLHERAWFKISNWLNSDNIFKRNLAKPEAQ